MVKINDTLVNYAGQFCFGAAAIAFPPVAAGVTAAVGATALVALFHAERRKNKDASQLDSDKALKKITARIADEWRNDLPDFGKHDFQKELHIAEEALKTALPRCSMDYATLADATTKGAGKFPDKATEEVLEQLARTDPSNFGENGSALAKKLADNVIRAAFMGAIENEDYFRKFQPRLLLAIAEKVGDIYDMQLALKELEERNFETLTRVDERTATMDVKLDQLLAVVGSLSLKRAEEIGLNEKQIETITRSFLKQEIPTELWGTKLVEGATRLTELEEELARLTNDEPEIAALMDLAREAIDRGDIGAADKYLAEAVQRDEEAGEQRLRRAADNEGRRGDLAMSEGRYIKAADHFARAARLIQPFDAEDWARLKYNEGTAAYQRGILDPERNNLDRAVSAYRKALTERTRDRIPLDWAMTQNNLGNALLTLGARGDDNALNDAVTAYREALTERTRDRVPLDWAATQTSLGSALATLGVRGDDAALNDAVAACREALKEYKRDRVPLQWAMAQNNLGAVLKTLGGRGDDKALNDAITAYRAAMTVLTRESVPLDWAATQNNLGNALAILGAHRDDTALNDAVAAFREALTERTRDRVPLDWAMTQYNLGNALQTIGERGDDKALKGAITAYREALTERTRERIPLDWAMTRNNLGGAMETLGDRDQSVKQWAEARNHYLAALEECTPESPPANEAIARENLDGVEAKLKAAGWAPPEGWPDK
ncbi:hypothetical protein WNY37_12860 [Henriciella sp. AS95]|uniref:hypothetical protein n=1 Tax=Henriciella sp. AS95 TaxID=3135782 RepID=UPI00316FCB42